MGYRRAKKTYKLVFADEEMEGLEVTMKALTVGEFMDLAALASKVGGGVDEDDLSGLAEAADAMFKSLADKLDHWNLEDEDGKPVEASYDGVRSQDMGFVLVIVNAWMNGIAAVPLPLPNGSSDGASSDPEQSLDLESLSSSLTS